MQNVYKNPQRARHKPELAVAALGGTERDSDRPWKSEILGGN